MNYFSLQVLALVLFTLSCALIETIPLKVQGAALMGIDFGSKFMKVSLVKPGRPFEIVLNPHTKRKSDSVFAIDQGDRLYGSDASNLATRKPEQVLFSLREMLGKNTTHPMLTELQNMMFNYELSHNENSGTIVVNLPGVDQEKYRSLLLVEELIAMLLRYAQKMAEEFGETPVRDCVITVPSFFTQSEREALLDAAEIAGINVLSLIDDNTAAALQYAIDNVYPDTTHRMLLYNMGALSTQVSLFEYTGKYIKRGSSNITQGEFQTLSKYWNTDISGSTLDHLLLEQFIAEYNEKFPEGGDIRDDPRAVARLLKTATKTKEVLSANMECPAGVESLKDGHDFRTVVTRKRLEEAASGLMKYITEPIDVVLASANLTKDDVNSIELVGGGVRVPMVKKTLASYFGSEMELGI